MNVETLQSISKVAFIVATAAFLISVLLFFLFHIPRLFDELTGRAEKKFIAEAQKKNEISESKKNTGTSEKSFSSGLTSESLNYPSEETAQLIPLQETTMLPDGQSMQNTEKKETDFFIIEEFSFTSSTEIIE